MAARAGSLGGLCAWACPNCTVARELSARELPRVSCPGVRARFFSSSFFLLGRVGLRLRPRPTRPLPSTSSGELTKSGWGLLRRSSRLFGPARAGRGQGGGGGGEGGVGGGGGGGARMRWPYSEERPGLLEAFSAPRERARVSSPCLLSKGKSPAFKTRARGREPRGVHGGRAAYILGPASSSPSPRLIFSPRPSSPEARAGELPRTEATAGKRWKKRPTGA